MSSYSVLVMFGRESGRRAIIPAFGSVMRRLVACLGKASVPLRSAVEFDGASRSGRPRAGKVTPKLIERWEGSLQEDSSMFCCFETFDQDWTREGESRLYGALGRTRYLPAARQADPLGGAENFVTVALRHDLVSSAAEDLGRLLLELGGELDVLQGWVNTDVPWDRPDPQIPIARAGVISLRWEDVTVEFGRAGIGMSESLHDLYQVLLVAEGHLLVPLDQIPESLLQSRSEVQPGRWHLHFTGDPQADPEFRAKVAPFFRLLVS